MAANALCVPFRSGGGFWFEIHAYKLKRRWVPVVHIFFSQFDWIRTVERSTGPFHPLRPEHRLACSVYIRLFPLTSVNIFILLDFLTSHNKSSVFLTIKFIAISLEYSLEIYVLPIISIILQARRTTEAANPALIRIAFPILLA